MGMIMEDQPIGLENVKEEIVAENPVVIEDKVSE
jgi:hypothetical protein